DYYCAIWHSSASFIL
nr:immunoglobulin light chain junction region [Macaca mulatta]MOW57360.1 immunoglobulin light chain junction region [Macaca mulatta]MOW57912.1 immunoglobulin light chain junction region [Macaca mulatta]MOW58138.1 immunoglobulin light chain junction region [Macaca mulatta]MOW58500.1 immunoglobulin light chain junction region [Macaca mulatta]